MGTVECNNCASTVPMEVQLCCAAQAAERIRGHSHLDGGNVLQCNPCIEGSVVLYGIGC